MRLPDPILAAVAPGTAVRARAALGSWGHGRARESAAVLTRATVDARAEHVARNSRLCCVAKLEAAFDLGSGTAVESIEDAVTIPRVNLVQHFVAADYTQFEVDLFPSNQRSSRGRCHPVLNDRGRLPRARKTRAPLPPGLSHEDDEIMIPQDRAVDSEATTRLGQAEESGRGLADLERLRTCCVFVCTDDQIVA
jgi:hypothetical protein